MPSFALNLTSVPSFVPVNLPPSFTPPEFAAHTDFFTLTARPRTDLQRGPENDTITAPLMYTSKCFNVAEVTVDFDGKVEGDQAGLVIFAGARPDQNNIASRYLRKWLKVGLELLSDVHRIVSVSAGHDGEDHCLGPLADLTSVRVKIERVVNSLHVWYQKPSDSAALLECVPGETQAEWILLRRIDRFFGVEKKSIHVGVYASRPVRNIWEGQRVTDELLVDFKDLDVF